MAVNIKNSASFGNLENVMKKGIEESGNKLIKDIPLEKIEPNPDNEAIFSMDGIESLKSSIETIGFTGAIEVYKVGKDRYQIISGHRRYRAMQELGRRTIPCIISELDDEITIRRKLIDSNINTRVLSPMELARAIKYYEDTLREAGVRTTNINVEIGKIFGISGTKVYKLKSLFSMAKELQDLASIPSFPYEAFSEAVNFSAADQKQLALRIQTYINNNPGAGLPAAVIEREIHDIDREIQTRRQREERMRVIKTMTDEEKQEASRIIAETSKNEDDITELNLPVVDIDNDTVEDSSADITPIHSITTSYTDSDIVPIDDVLPVYDTASSDGRVLIEQANKVTDLSKSENISSEEKREAISILQEAIKYLSE